MTTRAAGLLACLLLAGCGGGATTTATPPSPVPFKPTAHAFAAVAPLPEPRAYLAAVEVNGSLYAVGGLPPPAPGPPFHNTSDTVFFTHIRPDGSLDPWQPTSRLNVPRAFTVLVAWNPSSGPRWLYAAGGQADDLSGLASVERALVQADGALAPWEMADPLPVFTDGAAATRTGNTVVVIGASVPDPPRAFSRDLVVTSTLGPTGFGPWRGGASLPESTIGGSAFVAGDRVHAVVGYGANQWTTSTYSATLDASGNLEAWARGPSIGLERYHAGLATDGHGGAFLLGGIGRPGMVATNEHSATDGTGRLVGWTTLGALPVGTGGLASVTVGNSVYVIGGFTGGIGTFAETAAVWRTTIE